MAQRSYKVVDAAQSTGENTCHANITSYSILMHGNKTPPFKQIAIVLGHISDRLRHTTRFYFSGMQHAVGGSCNNQYTSEECSTCTRRRRTTRNVFHGFLGALMPCKLSQILHLCFSKYCICMRPRLSLTGQHLPRKQPHFAATARQLAFTNGTKVLTSWQAWPEFTLGVVWGMRKPCCS